MKRLKVGMLLSCLIVPPAAADLFGASEANIYLQLTKMFKTLEEQLKFAKKGYDVSSEIYALSQADKVSLDRVMNTDLVGLMNEKGWMVDGIKTLKDVAGINRQIEHLVRLMEAAEDAETRAQLQYAIDMLKQQRTVIQMTEQANKNLKKATTDLDERDSSRLTAENTAVLARNALAEQDRRNRLAAGEKISAEQDKQTPKNVSNLYKNLGKASGAGR